jgi:putative NADH-flavin reductase
MQVTVFGASGLTGQQLVASALAAGHSVIAAVRDPASVTTRHERLRVVTADVLDPAAVRAAIDGSDAVLTALGHRKGSAADVMTTGAKHLLAAMAPTQRLIYLSAFGVGESLTRAPFMLRAIFIPLFLKRIYADHAQAEALIQGTAKDWIIVRPVRLTNAPIPTGRVLTARGAGAKMSISRADTAAFMVAQLAEAGGRNLAIDLFGA